MGQTWKYESMFAPFSILLNQVGIDTVAVDWEKTDTHESIWESTKKLTLDYKPDYLFGYCYGSFVCVNAWNPTIKGIIMLDPSSEKKDLSCIFPRNEDVINRNMNILKPIPRIPIDKVKCKVDIIYTSEGYLNRIDGMQTKFFKNKKEHIIPDTHHKIMCDNDNVKLLKIITEIVNA